MVWITEHHITADFEVESEKGDSTYIVSWGDNQYLDGVKDARPEHSGKYDWSCTCKDWKYHRIGKGGYCKHILQVLDQRVLWSTDNDNDVIVTVGKEAFTRLAEIAASEKSYDSNYLLMMIGNVVDSAVHYAPFLDSNGRMVPVIEVSGDEYQSILANGSAIQNGGELTPEQFGMLVDYILDPAPENERRNLEKCVVKGKFYPNADYTLSSDFADETIRCSACSAASTEMNHVGGGGRVCTNPGCEKSVNHPVNIRNRRIAIAEKKTGA